MASEAKEIMVEKTMVTQDDKQIECETYVGPSGGTITVQELETLLRYNNRLPPAPIILPLPSLRQAPQSPSPVYKNLAGEDIFEDDEDVKRVVAEAQLPSFRRDSSESEEEEISQE